MKTSLNFTQALALRGMSNLSPETASLLNDLDKDLRKWNASVNMDPTGPGPSCVIDAFLSGTQYRYVLRVHTPVKVVTVNPADMTPAHRQILRSHIRARNVLKNFLPIVFDRLNAQKSFELVEMYVSGHDNHSQCIWVTNEAQIGMSIVTMIAPGTPEMPAKQAPSFRIKPPTPIPVPQPVI